jgi:hypothetical protein
MSRWISTAQRTASTTLANSTSRPSPVVLTMRPRCSAILGSQLAPMRLQPGERLLLLGSHQPAVAGDIGRQNGRQTSLDPLAGQARYSL